MATAEEITRLRSLTGDPTEDDFSDYLLNTILDTLGNMNRAASEVWGIRAARYSTLVNVSESGSTRNLGDLYKNAMAMKKHYDDAGVEGVARGRTRIGRIVRPDY
jgi:hypothetical protein